MPETGYVLGHSAGEVRRLELQSSLFAPGTERILRAAGLGPGMSILDIGTGAGDVAMLAAGLVGASGSVLGIDREASVLERARSRAEAAGLHHIRFEAATPDTLAGGARFDFVVGRYVLLFQPDRAGFLRRAAAALRPGGTLLVIEPSAPEPETPASAIAERWSHPPVALYEETLHHICVAFRLGGARVHTGAGLVPLFHEAGLPEPEMRREVPTGGPSSPIVEWLCLTLESLLPALERHGVTDAAKVGIDTLEPRLRAAVSAVNAQVRMADLVGAWARIG